MLKVYKKMIYVILINVIILAFLIAKKNTIIINFWPIDGDFQLYNGIRRLSQGEIPFKDFEWYIGMGVLYMNFLITFFNPSFGMSVFLTNFLNVIIVLTSIYLIFRKLLKKSNYYSIMATMCFMLIMYPLIFFDSIDDVNDFFVLKNYIGFLSNGVSHRFQRCFIIFLLPLVLTKIDKKSIFWIGIVNGIALYWSNDFGISVFLASNCIYLINIILEKNETIKKSVLLILGNIISLILIGELLTLGHLTNYFKYNFFNVSRSQFWYYDNYPKYISMSNIYFSITVFIGIFLIITNVKKNKYLSTVLLSALIGGYIYNIGSGSKDLFFIFELIMMIIILTYAFDKFKSEYLNSKKIKILSISVLIFSYFAILKNGIDVYFLMKDVNTNKIFYYKDLKTYVSFWDLGRLNKAKEIIGNDKLLSTYSSALDVMVDNYNFTGIDYIIHVLGDDYREKYIEMLNDEKPEFIQTTSPELSNWSDWSFRSNWFFFRVLLDNYEPYFRSDYFILWKINNEKKELDLGPPNLEISRIDSSVVEITLDGVNEIPDETLGEIYLEYKTKFTSKKEQFKKGYIKRRTYVTDAYIFNGDKGGYGLPDNSEGIFLPVKFINGVGKIRISVYPLDATNIEINNIKFIKYYIDKRSNLIAPVNLNDENWKNGVNIGNRREILLDERAWNSYKDKLGFTIITKNGEISKISDIISKNGYTTLILEDEISFDSGYPNILKIIDEKRRKNEK